MRRGDICLIDPEPGQGTGARKTRPAVIVSNDGANAAATRLGRGVITVVPVTSNVTRVYAFQVLLPAVASGLELDSKAQAEQVRSVDIARVLHRLGSLPIEIMTQLDDALRLHLAL